MKDAAEAGMLSHTRLFLAPWMLMYALSTLVLTHQEYVNSFYASKSPVMVKERELDYSRSFPTNVTRDAIAQQILNDLGMDGAHSVSGGRNGRTLVIQRQHALPQRRLTFDASKSRRGFRATDPGVKFSLKKPTVSPDSATSSGACS